MGCLGRADALYASLGIGIHQVNGPVFTFWTVQELVEASQS